MHTDDHQRETQDSVSEWAETTFGPVSEPAVLVRRAKLEMEELHAAVLSNNAAEVGHEVADVLILLYRLARIYGRDIDLAVNEKMKINRARQWVRKGDGTGRHHS